MSDLNTLPPLPPGQDLPPGISATDSISRTLNTLPPTQLLDIIREMKAMATNEPERAAELLNQAPQLAYAVFQAMLLMNLVTPETINSIVENSPQPSQSQPGAAGPGSLSSTPANTALRGGASLAENPEALMQAVMDLPQETIDQLPEDERKQIMQLRVSHMMQQHR